MDEAAFNRFRAEMYQRLDELESRFQTLVNFTLRQGEQLDGMLKLLEESANHNDMVAAQMRELQMLTEELVHPGIKPKGN